jgi:hypothetical protein
MNEKKGGKQEDVVRIIFKKYSIFPSECEYSEIRTLEKNETKAPNTVPCINNDRYNDQSTGLDWLHKRTHMNTFLKDNEYDFKVTSNNTCLDLDGWCELSRVGWEYNGPTHYFPFNFTGESCQKFVRARNNEKIKTEVMAQLNEESSTNSYVKALTESGVSVTADQIKKLNQINNADYGKTTNARVQDKYSKIIEDIEDRDMLEKDTVKYQNEGGTDADHIRISSEKLHNMTNIINSQINNLNQYYENNYIKIKFAFIIIPYIIFQINEFKSGILENYIISRLYDTDKLDYIFKATWDKNTYYIHDVEDDIVKYNPIRLYNNNHILCNNLTTHNPDEYISMIKHYFGSIFDTYLSMYKIILTLCGEDDSMKKNNRVQLTQTQRHMYVSGLMNNTRISEKILKKCFYKNTRHAITYNIDFFDFIYNDRETLVAISVCNHLNSDGKHQEKLKNQYFGNYKFQQCQTRQQYQQHQQQYQQQQQQYQPMVM